MSQNALHELYFLLLGPRAIAKTSIQHRSIPPRTYEHVLVVHVAVAVLHTVSQPVNCEHAVAQLYFVFNGLQSPLHGCVMLEICKHANVMQLGNAEQPGPRLAVTVWVHVVGGGTGTVLVVMVVGTVTVHGSRSIIHPVEQLNGPTHD